MRYELSNIEFLKRQIAALSDDPSLPWGAYPCLEWPRGRGAHGYGILRANGSNVGAHRLAYEAAHGSIPAGLFVCHHCDNRACFRPIHLFAGTNRDNVIDCAQKGRKNSPFGERHYSARFTEDDVLLIRDLRARGTSVRALAEAFGVTGPCISHVVNGRRWKHISPPAPLLQGKSEKGAAQ